MNPLALSRIVRPAELAFDFAGRATHTGSRDERLSLRSCPMPSLIRFLFTLAVLGGLIYGGMWALVMYVEPKPREMSVRIPNDRINPDY